MRSPFPGVDPYLEGQHYWEEFHAKFINYAQERLAERLPDHYEARIEERVSMVYFENVIEHRIEIRRRPGRTLVAVIELLSPSNKEFPGNKVYERKRLELIDEPIHLVEIDLLVGGQRLPMDEPLPPGDYYALVSRAERRPDSDVYAWTIRQPLPPIPIPLHAPDTDILLDLAGVFALTFERGRYARSIDYGEPLTVPLKPEDIAWAEDRARLAMQ